MQRGDFIVVAMSDSKRKGGSENLERRPEKALRMEDAPVVIVYDIETVHRHPCDQTPGGIPCFACANFVNVMQTTEIIEFAATVLEPPDYSESKKKSGSRVERISIFIGIVNAQLPVSSRSTMVTCNFVTLQNMFLFRWHGMEK